MGVYLGKIAFFQLSQIEIDQEGQDNEYRYSHFQLSHKLFEEHADIPHLSEPQPIGDKVDQ